MLSRRSFSALTAFILVTGSRLGAAEESYQIDSVHSAVLYKVRHLGVGNAWGRFNVISGSFTLDPAHPEKMAVSAQVKTDSLDTGNEKRDQHLKGPDFFNVKQFPEMTFKSKEVKKGGNDVYQVTADFTLHGVTKPITLEVKKIGSGKDPMGAFRTGFETTFTIRRSDYGMKFMPDAIGDEVQITVSVEGVRK